MGLFSSKSKKETKIHRTPEFDAAGKFVLGNIQNVFNKGFQSYNQPRFAEFNQDQLSGFNLARQFADPNSFTSQIQRQSLEKFANAPTLDQLSQYMNPFTQSVLDRTNYNLTRQFDAQRAKLAARQASGGAYGGSRFAVAQNELEDSFFDTLADTNYRALADAYERGSDRYYKTGIDAMNLSQLANKSDIDRFNALLSIGKEQQTFGQLQKDFDYNEFLRSINEPKQDLLSAGNLLAAYPTNTFDTTEKTKTSPSIASVAMGLAGAAAGIAGVPGIGSALGGLFGGGGGSDPFSSAIPGQGGTGFRLTDSGIGFSTPNFNLAQTPFVGSPLGGGGTLNTSTFFYTPPEEMKDGGYVKKKINPFDRKITGVSPEKNVTLDKNPFKGESKVKIEKALRFSEGGFNPFVERSKTGMFSGVPDKKINKPVKVDQGYPVRGKETTFNQIIGKYDKPKTKAPSIQDFLGIDTQSNKTPQNVQQMQPYEMEQAVIPDIPEEKSWMDRWMENPLTQIGIALMSGSGPQVFGGFASALEGNYQNREQAEDAQRQAEIERQININNENFRRQMAVDELAAQKQHYANQYNADMARVAQMNDQLKFAKDDKYTKDLVDLYEKNVGTILQYRQQLNESMQFGAIDSNNASAIEETISNLERENEVILNKFKKIAGIGTDPYNILEE